MFNPLFPPPPPTSKKLSTPLYKVNEWPAARKQHRKGILQGTSPSLLNIASSIDDIDISSMLVVKSNANVCLNFIQTLLASYPGLPMFSMFPCFSMFHVFQRFTLKNMGRPGYEARLYYACIHT